MAQRKYAPDELLHVFRIIRGNPEKSFKELERLYFCPSGSEHKGSVVLEYEVYSPYGTAVFRDWELIDEKDWNAVKHNEVDFGYHFWKHAEGAWILEEACTVHRDPVKVQLLVEKHNIERGGIASEYLSFINAK